jgi:NADH:ubiquinone oxidoreductase subunit 4 (subunit M)
MLISLLLIPIIGILNILINKNINIKKIGLIFSIINLILSLIIFILYDFSLNEFQFIQESYKINNYEIYLGIDGLSIYFVVRPLIKRLINLQLSFLNTRKLIIIFKSVLLRIVTELVLRKPTNLLDIEMIRGKEHVSKVLNKIKYKSYFMGKVIYIQAFIIMLLQNYSLALKILDTKCNHKCVEKQNAYLSSWLLKIKGLLPLKQ